MSDKFQFICQLISPCVTAGDGCDGYLDTAATFSRLQSTVIAILQPCNVHSDNFQYQLSPTLNEVTARAFFASSSVRLLKSISAAAPSISF